MRPPTKRQVFANFWPKSMLQPFITPLLSPRIFSVLQVENEVKMQTPAYMSMGLILNNILCLPHVSSVYKKSQS